MKLVIAVIVLTLILLPGCGGSKPNSNANTWDNAKWDSSKWEK